MVDLPESDSPAIIILNGGWVCRSAIEKTCCAVALKIAVPASLGLADHDLVLAPRLTSNLHPGRVSNGRALPALTVTTEFDTSAPSTKHSPRTATLAGPFTIRTLRWLGTLTSLGISRKNTL